MLPSTARLRQLLHTQIGMPAEQSELNSTLFSMLQSFFAGLMGSYPQQWSPSNFKQRGEANKCSGCRLHTCYPLVALIKE